MPEENTTNAKDTHNICLYRTREVKFFESRILGDKYIISGPACESCAMKNNHYEYCK